MTRSATQRPTLLALTALLLAMAVARVHASGPAEHVVFPWGDAPGSIGLIEVPDGRYGAQALVAGEDGSLVLLDTIGRRVVSLTPHLEWNGSRAIDEAGQDLAIASDGTFVVRYPDRLVLHSQDGKIERTVAIPSSLRFITGLTLRGGEIRLEESFSRTLELGLLSTRSGLDSMQVIGAHAGRDLDGIYVQAAVETSEIARIRFFDTAGELLEQIRVPFPEANLGSLRVLDRDAAGRLVLSVELLEQTTPIEVRRLVIGVHPDGERAWELELPGASWAGSLHDLALIDQRRALVAMIPAEDGMHLVKWKLPAVTGRLVRLEVPSSLRVTETPLSDRIPSDPSDPDPVLAPGDPISRQDVLDIADSYVMLGWWATSCNIGSADCGGKVVITPSWVTPGYHTTMPYKWGGFSSLDEFYSGLHICKYAGDMNTVGNIASSCAVGVDCSGFVSRCWNTPHKYSTRSLPNISYQITVDSMLPGDIFNRYNYHVRLLVSKNSNGTFNMVETTGAWRVGYTVRTLADHANYVPRRYDNIIDCGITVARDMEDTLVYFTPDSSPFDLVAGYLSDLHTDGDFSLATCLGTFSASPAVDTLPEPPPGDGRYYLARGLTTCVGESYGESSLVPDPRDDLDTGPCP